MNDWILKKKKTNNKDEENIRQEIKKKKKENNAGIEERKWVKLINCSGYFLSMKNEASKISIIKIVFQSLMRFLNWFSMLKFWWF